MKKNKGFTLIELLVVIAIIGILASVVMVSLGSSKNKAQAVATKRSLKSLSSSISLCCNSGGTLLSTPGGNICNPAVPGAVLFTASQLKVTNVTYNPVVQCATTPTITANISGHGVPKCDGAWIIKENILTPPTVDCK